MRELLHRIEDIGVRDFLVRANLPKRFDEIIRGKGILELLHVSNAGHAACGITHLPDFELIGSDVV